MSLLEFKLLIPNPIPDLNPDEIFSSGGPPSPFIGSIPGGRFLAGSAHPFAKRFDQSALMVVYPQAYPLPAGGLRQLYRKLDGRMDGIRGNRHFQFPFLRLLRLFQSRDAGIEQ